MPIIKSKGIYYNVADKDVAAFEKEFGEGLRVPERLAGKTVDYKPSSSALDNKWAVKSDVPKTPLPWEQGKDKNLLGDLAAFAKEQADKKERGEKAKQFQSKLGEVIKAVDYGKTTPTFEREKKTQTNQIKPQVFNVELPDGARKWMTPDGSLYDDAILANMAARSYVEEYNADDVLQPLQVRTEKRDGKDVPVYLLPTGEETDNVYYARALQKAYVGAVDKQRDTEKYLWELGVHPNQSPAQQLSIINDLIAKNDAAVKKYEKEHGSSYSQKTLLSLGMHSANPIMGMLEADQIYTNGYYDPKLKADDEYIRLRQEGENLFKAKLSVENELTDAGFLKGVGDAIITSNAMGIAKPPHVTAQEAAFNIVDPESTVILQSAMQYDKNRGAGYNIGKIAGGSIVFGAEMLSDGTMFAAGVAAKAVGKGVAKGLTKSLGKKAATVGSKVASGATGFGVAGLYNTVGTGSHRVLEDANEAMKGYVEVLGRGEFAQKDQTDAASAFGKAATRQFLEAGTEGIFAGGGLGLGKLLSSASKTKVGKFLGLSSIDKWLGYARSSQVGKMFNDIFKASGYHGLLEEGLEEEINIVLNSILVGDHQLSDLYDKKTQFELWAGMAASIGLMGALPGGMSIAQGAYNARKLKSAEKNLRSLLSPEYANTIIESIDNAYNSEFSNTLMGIIDNIGTHGNTMKQREAVMDYAKAVLIARGYNNQRLADAEGGELSVGDAITQAMMNTGATISEDQQKGIIDAYQRAGRELDNVLGLSNVEVEDIDEEGNYTAHTLTYEDVANNVDNGTWSYEQGVAAVKYLQAKAMRDGVMLSARDEISESVSRAKKKIADHTHTDGNIYEATDVLGRQVYIVSGNVATKEDGVIDDANSSKSLVVVNGETGAREMVPPSRIDKLGYVANAEKEAARTEEEVGKAVTEAVANRLDGIQAGMLVEIPNENGENTPMEIVRTNGETILLMDGSGNTHEMSRNEVLSFISPNEISSPQADVDNSVATSTEASPAPVEKPKYTYKGKERTAYHLMPIEETLGEMYDELEMDSEAVNSVADANIAEVEEELEKHSKKEPKAPTLGADLGEYRDALSKYKEVHAAWEAQAEEISKRKAYWEEVKASVAEFTKGESTQSELPYETPEMYIASQLGSIKITPNSFRRETGLGVEEQRKLVGIIATKEKGGVTIERASEMLSEDTHLQQLGMTDQTEIRDAIISILREGHPRGYAKRQAQSAETESEERLKDALANELGFASFDEYMEYEETVLPLVLSRYRGFNEEEYYNNLANNEYGTRRENTETPESDGVLFGEQPATADRIGDIEAERQGADVSAGVQGSAENAIASTEVDRSDINMVAPWGEYYAEETATRSPNVDNKIDELKAKERLGNAKKRATQKYFEKERSSAAKNIKKNEFIAKVLAKMLGVDVQIHTSKEDITSQNVLIAIDNVERNGGQVRGWYSNGVANIYLPHIFSVDDIVETIMHESVGHKSISDIFTEEERNTLYDNVWDSMSQQDQQKFLGYVKNEKNQQDEDVTLRRKAADEYVAHIAEKLIYGSRLNEKEKSVWDKIINFFKYILGRRYAELDKEFYTTSGQMLSYESIENLLIATHKAARKGGSMQNGSAESEGESFSFIGEKGATNLDAAEEATVRMDNLAIARDMESAGKDALTIKIATGWERGADEKWRYEEMDVEIAHPQDIIDGLREGKVYPLSEVLTKDTYDHFITEYPEYADIVVVRDRTPDATHGGAWVESAHAIAVTDAGLRGGVDYIHSLMVHELQHAIQSVEGFAQGGNSSMPILAKYRDELVKSNQKKHDEYKGYREITIIEVERLNDELEKLNEEMQNFMAPDNLNPTEYFELAQKAYEIQKEIESAKEDLEVYDEVLKESEMFTPPKELGYEGYKRLAGEVEARNSQERMGMSMDERRRSLASETADVAKEDQLFIYNALESASEADGGTMFSTIDDVQHYASSVGSMAQEFGLRPSAMTNIIGSREELEQYKKFLDEEIYEMVVSAYNDKCTGYTLSGIRLVFIFRENLHDEHEGQITWWHEQTHCAYNNLALQDKAELAQAALDWLEENSPYKYDVIKRYYKKEKQESEGVAVFIEEQIERHGIRNFIESDFADLGELAKLADVIRNAIKYGTEETNKQIEVYHRLRQPSTQPDSRGNWVIENSSNHERRVDGGTNSELKGIRRDASQRGGVLNPKSSEDNAGNYSNASNDIRFSIANRNQVGFVSNAMKAVEGIKQEKATPSQWLAMIQKQGGLKAGEDKWLGLSEWLKGSDAKTLTKDEVLEFIGDNMIQIEEVNYTETADSFNELKEEYENLVREEGFDAANEEMTNRYGDDFYIAFEDLGGELTIANEEAAAALLGSDNIIYGTRLDYTTEGLTNKREIALTVPTIESWNRDDYIHFGDAGDGRAVAWIRFGETFAYDVIDDVQMVDDFHAPYENYSGRNVYKPIGGSARDYVVHEKGRNGEMIYVVYINEKQLPVAHATLEDARIAMNEYYKEHPRKLRKPRKVLVIDEIQSKRHQEGREKGYKSNTDKFLKDNGIGVVETDTHFEFYKNGEIDKSFAKALLNDIEEAKNLYVAGYEKTAVPSAPFDKNWHELAVKRMLRLAAEEGFDKVAWTTGAQQAKRYDLGKQVDEINVYDTYDGTHQVQGTKDGIQVFSEQTQNGEAGLAELIGREMARKAYSNLHEGKSEYLVNGGYVSLKGDNLIGGEGMKGFYDKMLPLFLNKYGKKWGVKVGEVTLPELEESAQRMWAIDVTPEMKESVGEQTMFSAKRKAPETVSVQDEHHQTVISSADGAKVLKDLDSAITEYENDTHTKEKTFLGRLAKILGATKHGSNSKYATFETMNGNIVTIRLSNHNARVSTFDNHNEQEGISIVVTAQDNNGVDNDGTAHVVEFFYDAIKLRKADGKPLVEILKSIKQSLYSGVYKDTTGLAEREEVNTMFSTVYHGSSSKFDKFDHSFMGTGEGHQAFGWGTYVSEVKGIAKTYAGISGQTMMTYKGQELDTESFDSPWRIIKDLYGESGGRLRDMRNRAERILGMVEEDNVDMKQLWQNVVDTLKKVRAGELKVKPIRQLYTVEIPDDNGSNYLYNEVDVPTNVKRDVKQRLYEVLAADEAYKGAERELRQELDHVFNLEQDGANLYGNVSAYLGSDKAASEFLNAMGIVGIKYPTNTLSGGNKDGSSNYVIFNDSDLKIEDRTMFSIVPASTIAQEWYDEAVRVEGGWRGFRNKVAESWFDDVRSVLKLQEAIEMQTGKPIRGMDNAYAQLIALSSKNHYDLQLLMDQNINPLTQFVDDMIRGKKMYGKKVRLEDVEKYLNAKHGLERNRVMARRDAEEQATREYKENLAKLNEQLKADPENQSLKDRIDAMDAGRTSRIESETERIYQDIRVEKDYSGLTELFSDGNATLFEIEELAQEYVEDFEDVMQGDTTELWSKINEISKGTLKKQFLSGLISKADYDNIRNMYEYYVPLRGWKTDYAGDVYGYVTQSGKPNAIAPRPKRAKGRKSAATNIFGTLFNDANSAIVQGNKNMVKQALYRIAEKYGKETMLLQPSEVWATENSNGELVIEYPNFTPNASAETHMREYEEWLQRIQELEAEGRAKKITVKNAGKDFSLKMAKWQDQQHVIRVMNNGKEKMVYILGNPRAAQAINGLLNVSYNNDFVHMVVHIVSSFNSFKARVLTSLNPEFVVSNYERDIATVIANSYINKGAEYTAKVVKYAALHNPTVTDPRSSIYTLMVKANKGTLDIGKEEERYFKEFVEQGGMTGVTTARTIEDYQRRMKRAVDKGTIPGKRLAETLLESIEFINSCVENCNRFAVYRASRESGEEIQDAILDAKNSSLNFSRKGSGAMGNAAFRTLYLFANPVMQAIYMQRGWFTHHGARGATVRGLVFATAIGSALMYSTMFGGDDDDEKKWYGLSEWNRYNYINIPAGDGWFHISIAQEFRPIWTLGNVIIDLKNGVIDEQRAAKIMLSQINNYSPIALTDTKQFPTPDDSYLDVLIKGVTPSFLSDIADTFWNTNFYGNKIHNQTEYNQYAPEWKRVGRDTPQWVIDFAEKIDKATGGKENKKGILGKYTNPSKVYYVVSETFGGTGKFLGKCWNLGEMLFAEKTFEDYKTYELPFVSKFWIEGNANANKARNIYSDYKAYEMEYKVIKWEIDKNRTERGMSMEEKIDRLAEMKESGELERYAVMKKYETAIGDLYDKRKELDGADNNDAVDRIDEEITNIRKSALVAMKSLDAGGNKEVQVEISYELAKDADKVYESKEKEKYRKDWLDIHKLLNKIRKYEREKQSVLEEDISKEAKDRKIKKKDEKIKNIKLKLHDIVLVKSTEELFNPYKDE